MSDYILSKEIISWVSVWEDKVGRHHSSLAALLSISPDLLLTLSQLTPVGVKRSLSRHQTNLASFVKCFGSLHV